LRNKAPHIGLLRSGYEIARTFNAHANGFSKGIRIFRTESGKLVDDDLRLRIRNQFS
jgi:hypothetical protein